MFYDDLLMANGLIGIHHMLDKLLKDTYCKYKIMQGYKAIRKIQGLPVET